MERGAGFQIVFSVAYEALVGVSAKNGDEQRQQ